MEENIVEDQVQEDVSEDTSDTSAEQSEATSEEGVETSKLYKTPDGREMSADEIYEEYNKLLPEFTRRSQKLSEYEKEMATREARVQEEAAQAVSDNELLRDVDPNVAEAIKQIVTPVIQDALRQRDERAAQEARDAELRQRFDSAEKKYSGGDGYPKFDRAKVTSFMLDNEVYDPEKAYILMNRDAIIDAEVRKALKGKDTKSTESTKGKGPIKPEGKKATSFEEASKRAISRL